jgi:hypothetical protein
MWVMMTRFGFDGRDVGVALQWWVIAQSISTKGVTKTDGGKGVNQLCIYVYNRNGSESTHLTVSPQVGSSSPSHIKLPTKAQTKNGVAGMNAPVATMTGFINIFKKYMSR